MPLRGGASEKAGNRYERQWTTLALLDVLAGDAEYIRIEVPGPAGRGAEFLLTRNGIREWHQVKRQRAEGPWTIASLGRAGVLAPWWPKLQAGDRCVFVSGTSADQLCELAERAAQAESWTEFDEEFLGAGDHRDHFEALGSAWGTPPDELVFRALRLVSVHVIDEKQLKGRVRDRAAVLLDGDPAAVARHLSEIVDDSVHRRLAAPEILDLLAGSGPVRTRTSAGQDNGQHASGKRQAILDSAGRRPRLLAGLLVVIVIAAAAVYLGSRNSGTPEYYQSGPVADIYVPPPTVDCANVTPDLLISPAADELTDVSEVHALSLDGRSAFLMSGDLGNTTYYWVITDPNGDRGGMQLWWSQKGRTAHSCSVGFNDAPGAVRAQEGIRQLASLAAPSIMNNEPVNFSACIWYTAQEHVTSQCWP
jgi:hypothetical protein